MSIYFKKSASELSVQKLNFYKLRAKAICDARGSFDEIGSEIDTAGQVLREELRDHLGLYDWNKE